MVSTLDTAGAPQVQNKDMPFVTWVTQTVEDKPASLKAGRLVYKDVDYARITPPGSKDVQFEALPQWWDKIEALIANGRVPMEWLQRWQRSYESYKKGQELPVEGTPIRGWNLASGAMQENIIRTGILTVEQMAAATDEALTNIGMGAGEYKRRAQAWLRQGEDKAAVSLQMSALQKENASLKKQVETLQKKFEDLKARKKDEAA